MKKFIAGFIAGVMLLGAIGVVAAVGLRDVRIADTVSLWVHGRRVETDIIHAVRDDNPYGFGRNYVSARDLAESLGYEVDWCGETGRILVNWPSLEFYAENPWIPNFGSILGREPVESEIMQGVAVRKLYYIGDIQYSSALNEHGNRSHRAALNEYIGILIATGWEVDNRRTHRTYYGFQHPAHRYGVTFRFYDPSYIDVRFGLHHPPL